MFIKLHESMKEYIDVQHISEYLMTNLDKCQVRFAYRFMPVSLLCKASGNIDEFKRMAKPIVQKFVHDRKQAVIDENVAKGTSNTRANFSWCVEFKARNN